MLGDREQQLEKTIVDTSDIVISEYENTKRELQKIYDYIADGSILRSKAQWYDEGEKNTHYFLSLEKRNKTKSHICKLIDNNNDEIMEQ